MWSPLSILTWTFSGSMATWVGRFQKPQQDVAFTLRGVRDVAAIHEGIEPMFDNSDAPLFARRGLFR